MERESSNVMPASADDALASFCPEGMRESVAAMAPLLYGDLKKMAHRERQRLFSPQTLQTTALINETFLKLSSNKEFESRTHFLRTAAITMRHLLINRVEWQRAAKRGGGVAAESLDEIQELVADFEVADPDTVLAVHQALLRLARFSPRLAEVVECRFFAGYSEAEIAEALGVTERTVRRDWTLARAWLARELGDQLATAAMPEGTHG